eukprot:scaffold226325_cov40-Attheya_sp.AAC.1
MQSLLRSEPPVSCAGHRCRDVTSHLRQLALVSIAVNVSVIAEVGASGGANTRHWFHCHSLYLSSLRSEPQCLSHQARVSLLFIVSVIAEVGASGVTVLLGTGVVMLPASESPDTGFNIIHCVSVIAEVGASGVTVLGTGVILSAASGSTGAGLNHIHHFISSWLDASESGSTGVEAGVDVAVALVLSIVAEVSGQA